MSVHEKQETFLDALLRTPRVGSVNGSPDTKWVVWNWINLEPVMDLYVTQSDGSGLIKKLTDFGQNTHFCSWTMDNRHIIASHDYDGDERSRLYLVDIETCESKPLTPEHPDYYIYGGQIHPNGKYLVYTANYDFTRAQETEASPIYRQDLTTGERRILAQPKKPGRNVVEMNDAGTHIFYTRSDNDPGSVQLWLVDIEGNNDREILNFGSNSKVDASWHKNNKDILFIVEEGAYNRAGSYDIETDRITWIIDDPKRNITHIDNPYGTDLIKVREIEQAEYKTSFISADLAREIQLPATRTISPMIPLGQNRWLSKYFNSQQPDTMVIWDATSGEVIRDITNAFETLPYCQDDLSRATSYHWTSVDGVKIQGWLYRPQGKARGTVVSVHGGPTAHSADYFDREVQYYISRGLNVLDPNYRGSTGFDLEFQELIKKDGWGGKEQEDILEGIKALIHDGIAELYKIGITGTSYGGYSAWHAITHFPLEYLAAAAPICGMTDLIVDYETTRPDLRGYSEEMMGGSPSQVPEKYKERSPINFIQNIRGKLLIIQGARDPNVTPENVAAVEKELKKYSVPYEKLLFEDEGHGISKPKNQKILYTRIANFFEAAFLENKS